jgi:hypothetical protein
MKTPGLIWYVNSLLGDMNNICTCSAIVILQDAMPLVPLMDILPGTQPTQYYQSWRLGHEK